jgi:hypothetical protein
MISIVDNVFAEIIADIAEGEHCCKEQRQEYGEMASWQPPIAQIRAKESVRLVKSFWEKKFRTGSSRHNRNQWHQTSLALSQQVRTISSLTNYAMIVSEGSAYVV